MSLVLDGGNGVTFPNSTVQASAGSVIQVVNATYSTSVTNTTTSYIDTGLTATITPKFASSKILVIVDETGISKSAADIVAQFQLVRNGTGIISFEQAAAGTASSATIYVGGSGTSYLDSPATTSAVTYKTQIKANGSGGNVSVQSYGGSTSTITLLEIAA